MSEKKRKILVFAVFIAALVWGYFSLTDRMHKKAPSPKQTRTAAVTANPVEKESAPQPLTDDVCREYEELLWGKDPFYHNHEGPGRTATAAMTEKQELHLLGILYREVNAQALINNRVVSIGDNIGQYRITAISRDHVTLEDGRQTIVLRVEKESS
jgi:hypothetical protein